MIALATDFGSTIGGDASKIEIDSAPFSQLLSQVLTVIESGKLNHETMIKLIYRCNFGLFNLAQVEVQTQWLTKACEMLPAATQNLTQIKFGTFQLLVTMWKPIIAMIDEGNMSGQLSHIGFFLSEQAKILTLKLIECMVEGNTFDEGDPFEEELSNPKGVKDITSAIS